MAQTGLEVRQLYSERDDRVLFAELCFTLNAGDVLQIAGPNGSGKTALLEAIYLLSVARSFRVSTHSPLIHRLAINRPLRIIELGEH